MNSSDNKAQLAGIAICCALCFAAYSLISPVLGQTITALLGLPAFLFLPHCHRMAKTLFPSHQDVYDTCARII